MDHCQEGWPRISQSCSIPPPVCPLLWSPCCQRRSIHSVRVRAREPLTHFSCWCRQAQPLARARVLGTLTLRCVICSRTDADFSNHPQFGLFSGRHRTEQIHAGVFVEDFLSANTWPQCYMAAPWTPSIIRSFFFPSSSSSSHPTSLHLPTCSPLRTLLAHTLLGAC